MENTDVVPRIEGGLQHYNHSVSAGDRWGLRYFVLYNNGMLTMHQGDSKDTPVESEVDLKDVHDYLCVGQYTNNVPGTLFIDKSIKFQRAFT
jgi:hypothetical protein